MTITVTISNVNGAQEEILRHISQFANIEGVSEIGGGVMQDKITIDFVENTDKKE